MDNYYAEFVGELKDDVKIQDRFTKHYNKWCKLINEYTPKLNDIFDRKWKGEPIQDYSQCDEYNEWMLLQYEDILRRSGMKRDLFLEYYFDDEIQFWGRFRYGKRKGHRISFVLKRG